MFLENKENCYLLNREYSIVVLLQEQKKLEKEKSSTNQYFAKMFCVGKIDGSSGRETQKKCSSYLLRKNVAIIAKRCSLSYIKSIIHTGFETVFM